MLLLGNQVNIQVEIYLRLSYFARFGLSAAWDIFCVTNGIAYNVMEHHFLPEVSERYNYERDYVERKVLSIVCFDQEDC